MTKRSRLKNTVVRSDTVTTDSGEYRYVLYESESSNVASYRMPLYSIKIELTDMDGNKTESKVENVFCDVGKAVVFYDHLVENLATPLNLPYILEDRIS